MVYWWADGLYVKAGIADRKRALLTIVGALSTGEKIVLACESGERKSKESWLQVLRRLRERGLKFPRLTVADGHLGIWATLGEIHPIGEEQRCWNHKLTNVLDALPKKAQATAAERLKAMPYAETQVECDPGCQYVDAMNDSLTPRTVDGPTVGQMPQASDSRAGNAAADGYRRSRCTP